MRYAILILMCLLLTGCKTCKIDDTKWVETTDTVYVSKVLRDSIWLHDSIYEKQYMQGDTVIVYKYKQKIQYVDKYHTDTVYESKTDTVTITQTVTQQLTNWERFKQSVAYLVIGMLIAVLGIFFIEVRTKG